MTRLLAALSLALLAPPAASQDREAVVGEVQLAGDLWAGGRRTDVEGRAMVCGLKGPSSFLSVRAGPDVAAEELLRLPPLGIVELTGRADADRAWVEARSYLIEMTPEGRTLPADAQVAAPLHGWVHSRYLCNYLY